MAFETPILLSFVPNQNLAALTETDYIIIAANAYTPAAKKLQAFYQKVHGLKVEVINPINIYNEFSGGQASPIAIRNFLKHLYNRSALSNYKAPRYLLLLGIGNFDLSKIDPATQIPVYESAASNEVLSSYSTDDFYGILDDNEDINYPNTVQKLRIAIGRIPARNVAEADTTIEKIIQYQLGKHKGAWRNQITWIADDGDYNLHLQDAESISNHLKTTQPNWNQQKIYLDLYPAVTNAGGLSYPVVNNEIKQAVNRGSLMLNYTGHGNYLRLSEEAVISQSEIEQWNNASTLPLLVTASCDFAPFDQPAIKPIGFDALMKNSKGIIGLVSASRLVFAYSNQQINDQFIQKLMVPNSIGKYLSLGEALQGAKDAYFAQNGDRLNGFKFNLMGDPAMQLAFPVDKVKLKAINQIPFILKDTIQAGSRSHLTGWVASNGELNEHFNGVVDFMLLDASKEKLTAANQSSSMVAKIKTQENVLFRGSANVVNGQFEIDFLIPKEVTTTAGTLRMQWYAYNDSSDALGVCDSIFVRPFSNSSQQDMQGPVIRMYINDTTTKNIGWVSSNANLFVYLEDSSGIQTSGNALGQDIQLVIDDAVESPINLNNYYTSNFNTYQSGWVRYTLPVFTEGKHKIVLRAWDLLGNSSRDTLYFEVPNDTILSISHLKNVPNPFNVTTRFSFDRSQIVDLQDCTLELFDSSGRQVYKTMVYSNGTSNRVSIDWDGRTNDGHILAPGVYYYRISVINAKEKISLTNKLIKL